MVVASPLLDVESMKLLVAIGITVIGTLTAHAQAPGAQVPPSTNASNPSTPTTYVAAGLSLGVDGAVDWLYSGWSLDGGYRIGDTLWVHANVSMVGRSGYGTTNHLTIQSPVLEWYAARLGLETHRCHTAALCVVAGVDGGLRSGALDGWQVVPRLGLDTGGVHLRFRATAELLIGNYNDPSGDGEGIPDFGIGVTAGVGYQW